MFSLILSLFCKNQPYVTITLQTETLNSCTSGVHGQTRATFLMFPTLPIDQLYESLVVAVAPEHAPEPYCSL
jgi:hypothetical protein